MLRVRRGAAMGTVTEEAALGGASELEERHVASAGHLLPNDNGRKQRG